MTKKPIHEMSKKKLIHIAQEYSKFCKDNHVDTFDEVLSILRKRRYKRDREHMFVVLFNGSMNIVKILHYTENNKISVSASPDILYRDIIAVKNVHGILFAHTHPTNGTEPSKADINITFTHSALLSMLNYKVIEGLVFNDNEVSQIIQPRQKEYKRFLKKQNKALGFNMFGV